MDFSSHLKKWNDFNKLEENVITSFLQTYVKSDSDIEKDFIAIGFRIIIDITNLIHSKRKNRNFTPVINYVNELKQIKYRNRKKRRN